jgi:hypothetical protein
MLVISILGLNLFPILIPFRNLGFVPCIFDLDPVFYVDVDPILDLSLSSILIPIRDPYLILNSDSYPQSRLSILIPILVFDSNLNPYP